MRCPRLRPAVAACRDRQPSELVLHRLVARCVGTADDLEVIAAQAEEYAANVRDYATLARNALEAEDQ